MTLKGTRKASHADSWYEGNASTLSAELDGYLGDVPAKVNGKELPVANARAVIAP